MNVRPDIGGTQPMTVDEFLVWAEGRPGRYELYDGVVYKMSPELVRHANGKIAAYLALRDAIRRSGQSNLFVMPDGMTIRIDPRTACEPDALVYQGSRADPDAIEIENAIIVVEVISPSTKTYDSGAKLTRYFSVPGIQHYLLVDGSNRTIVHHSRTPGQDVIATRLVRQGKLILDPPALDVEATDFFDFDR